MIPLTRIAVVASLRVVTFTWRSLLRKFAAHRFASAILAILILILLLCTLHTYSSQKLLRTEAILTILGHDRNTSASVMPGVNTVIMEPTHGCMFRGSDTRAIMMVPTTAARRDRRENIRQTWGGTRYFFNVMVFFVVGKVSSGDYKALAEEARLHGDLIVENLDDHYYGLTIKTLRMLKWFHNNCPSSPYFIKVDDDVFVNMRLLLETLSKLPQDFQIGGRVLTGRTPNLHNPFSKWYTPPEIWKAHAVAPPYIGGPFYVIKGSLVPELLEASYQVPLYHLEDVFLSGMVASQQLKCQLYEFPGTIDPKFPWFWYFRQKYFGSEPIHKAVISFHTDGEIRLMKQLFEDTEEAQVF